MGYLLTQMFLYMVGAFLLGLLLGRLVWGRLRARIASLKGELAQLEAANGQLSTSLSQCGRARGELEAQLAQARASSAAATVTPMPVLSSDLISNPSEALPAKPDDLRRLIGIGPVNEERLHKAGITTFAQIAAWTAQDIARIEQVLEFDGRIERERWIEQAKLLAAGDEEEFLRRFPAAGTERNT